MTPAGTGSFQDFRAGFTRGALIGLRLFLIYFMARNTAAMKDEARLKKLFIKENDERSQQIIVYTRSASTQTFLFAGLAAAVTAGFFSMAVSLTVASCILANGLIATGFKIHFDKKF